MCAADVIHSGRRGGVGCPQACFERSARCVVIASVCRVRRRFNWLLVVSAALAAAGVLAGCTSSGGQHLHSALPTGTVAPVSASPSPTPSRTGPLTTGPNVRPGEKPPTLGQTATGRNPSGALSFAVYYYRALDWSLATTDPYLLAQISAASCQTCRSHIEAISHLRSKSGHIQGGRIRVNSASLVDRREQIKSDYVIELKTSQEATVFVNPDGTKTAGPPASTGVSYVLVSWTHGRWTVVEESEN